MKILYIYNKSLLKSIFKSLMIKSIYNRIKRSYIKRKKYTKQRYIYIKDLFRVNNFTKSTFKYIYRNIFTNNISYINFFIKS